jgi:hypothetical protein
LRARRSRTHVLQVPEHVAQEVLGVRNVGGELML